MTATELLDIDTDAARAETSPLVQKANAMTIASQADLELGANFLREIKTAQARVADLFDPPIQAAHKSHKAAIAAKHTVAEPLREAERALKGKIGTYQQEEEQKRRKLEAELRAKAQREEEERRLEEAARLEKDGRQEEAEALIEEPVPAPVVVVPKPAAPAGVSTRKVWRFRVINPKAIPLEFMKPDEQKLGAYARSMKEQALVTGVEFYDEASVAAKGY